MAPAPAARRAADHADVAACALLTLVAAAAATTLPDGSALRFALAAAFLLLVPGYALLQAALVPAAPAGRRAVHLAVGIGISPAVVGILALLTALFADGFRPGPILLSVSLGCIALCAVASWRRAAGRSRAAAAANEANGSGTPAGAGPGLQDAAFAASPAYSAQAPLDFQSHARPHALVPPAQRVQPTRPVRHAFGKPASRNLPKYEPPQPAAAGGAEVQGVAKPRVAAQAGIAKTAAAAAAVSRRPARPAPRAAGGHGPPRGG